MTVGELHAPPAMRMPTPPRAMRCTICDQTPWIQNRHGFPEYSDKFADGICRRMFERGSSFSFYLAARDRIVNSTPLGLVSSMGWVHFCIPWTRTNYIPNMEYRFEQKSAVPYCTLRSDARAHLGCHRFATGWGCRQSGAEFGLVGLARLARGCRLVYRFEQKSAVQKSAVPKPQYKLFGSITNCRGSSRST